MAHHDVKVARPLAKPRDEFRTEPITRHRRSERMNSQLRPRIPRRGLVVQRHYFDAVPVTQMNRSKLLHRFDRPTPGWIGRMNDVEDSHRRGVPSGVAWGRQVRATIYCGAKLTSLPPDPCAG